jgi:lysophospholipase L1-like esterase
MTDASLGIPVRSLATQFANWVQVLLAIGQAAVVLTGLDRHRFVGLVVAALACGLGLWRMSERRRLRLLIGVSMFAMANLCWHLTQIEPPFPYRLAHVAILAGYVALGLAGAIVLLRAPAPQALLLSAALAGAVVAAEAALVDDAVPESGSLIWEGGPVPHQVLGEYYAPHSTMRTIYPSNPRGYFDETAPAEKTASGAAPRSSTEYSVTYRFNGLGCRGPDYPIPRPPGRRRIVALGDSFTLGVGVQEQDTFSARLERRLRERHAGAGAYDVINCGVSGYATREERLHYELFGAQYDPDLVLLSAVFNDDVSWLDEQRLGYVHRPGKYESLFETLRRVQALRTQGRRPFDYTASMGELRQLIGSVRSRGARLAVVVFAGSPSLFEAVKATLKGTGVPVLEVDVWREDRVVHAVDDHPNDVAHGLAAEQIEAFLARNGLIAVP